MGRIARKSKVKRPLSLLQEKVLRILSGEQRYYTQSDIARFLKISQQRVNYHVKLLLKKQYIEVTIRSRCVNYRLTLKGTSYLQTIHIQKSLTGGDGVRCHNIVFKSELFARPSDFIPINGWRSVKVKNWEKFLKRYRDVTVEVTPSSVVFYVNEFYAKNADEGAFYAWKVVERTINELVMEFNGLKLGRPVCQSTILKQSYALEEDPFAKKVRKQGLSIVTPRYEVDSSNKDELEFVHALKGQEDTMKYTKMIDAIIDGRVSVDLVEKVCNTDFSKLGLLDRLVVYERFFDVIVGTQRKIVKELEERNELDSKILSNMERLVYGSQKGKNVEWGDLN